MKRKILIFIILSLVLTSFPFIEVSAAYDTLINGDVNDDGIFNTADIALFQKWLLTEESELAEQNAANLCKDDTLDVFDMCMMKKVLTENISEQIEKISSPICKSAALYCADDRKMIYSDNINNSVAPASLTKLLTASTALHYLSADTIVTVGYEQKLVKPHSSLCLIAQKHRLKLYDLLTGMLMASGNDAAYTAAVSTARAVYPNDNLSDEQAVERFAGLMNDFAESIGMHNSNFVNPEGWDDANQYTTVKDLMILARYAFSVPEIHEIVGNYKKRVVIASGETFNWTNLNGLLNPNGSYYCPYAVGMKTGTTDNAGACLIGAYIINEKLYISTVVGCSKNADRYELTLKLISKMEELL